MASQEFRRLLETGWPELSADQVERVSRFRDFVVEENERQNLTRLLSPSDFFEGHVLDVRELLRSALVEFPAMDLGSGAGVPGLLAALIRDDTWVLAESEGMKARFLQDLVRKLGVEARVAVFSGRAEALLASDGGRQIKTIVARAVGPVGRIYSWLRTCSTWNSLVLLKGPRWEAEWAELDQGPYRGELTWVASHPYQTGEAAKQRITVRLDRVPRGTMIQKTNHGRKKVAPQKKHG